MANSSSIYWLRNDLRLEDNLALLAACERGGPIIPVYIWSPEEEGVHPPGEASRWWLHHSLESLDKSLQELGSRLTIRTGDSFEQLQFLIRETRATAVIWNRRYEPAIVDRDKNIKSVLREQGLVVESFNASLLREPWEVATKQGKPYQVFTPFWKTCRALGDPEKPIGQLPCMSSPAHWPTSVPLESLELRPRLNWADGFGKHWAPGEAGAKEQLNHFVSQNVQNYKKRRDMPSGAGTSRLSPHLHFGEIGPRQVWHAVMKNGQASSKTEGAEGRETFLSEVGWREFAHHVLYHFPQTATCPLRQKFEEFPWQYDRTHLQAWQRGQTGYPIVDAGMRELWETGWMHNRVRMIVGSFLTKDLLLSWREGADWFWDTLVDADLANNTLGWQWISGCGADAAPYFRIFNPISQGEKFDPQGDYVRRWNPELANLPARWIHQPWNAPHDVLQQAGVRLGIDYPQSIVDHAQARQAALDAFSSIKNR